MENTVAALAMDDLHVDDSSSSGDEGDENGAPVIPFHAAPLGDSGVCVKNVGYLALARDLFHFQMTGQVPEALHNYVPSSKSDEADWYEDLLTAWKAAEAPPSNAEEATELVLEALESLNDEDKEGFLSFYGLRASHEATVPEKAPSMSLQLEAGLPHASAPWPKGVLYDMYTLPVGNDGVSDGDSLIVYVDTSSDAREAKGVPFVLQDALAKWRAAEQDNNRHAKAMVQKQINKAGYKIMKSECGYGTLARKYKVVLRGIDAPELDMPFGPEAKSILQSLVEGKPLHLLVYNIERYGRLIADVWCDKGFVQEILLRKGACWHCGDKRHELSEWEEEARNHHKGLWAEEDPMKPWEHRDNSRKGRRQ